MFKALCSWICKHGGYVHPGLVLKETKDGQSIHTETEIRSQDKLIIIPKKCIITGDCLHCIDTILTEMQTKNSFYKLYLKSLPVLESFNEHPLLKEEITLIPAYNQYKIELQAGLRQVQAKLKNKFNQKQILYGYLLYVTRAWKEGFVPVADLFQHRSYNACTCSYNDNFCEMSSGDNYNLGDEVYDSYGCKNNLELLVQYNFCVYPSVYPISFWSSLNTYQQDIVKNIIKACAEPPYFEKEGPNKTLLLIVQALFEDNWQNVLTSFSKNILLDIPLINNDNSKLATAVADIRSYFI